MEEAENNRSGKLQGLPGLSGGQDSALPVQSVRVQALAGS